MLTRFRNTLLSLLFATTFGCGAATEAGGEAEGLVVHAPPIQLDPQACLTTAIQKISDKAWAARLKLGNSTSIGVETIAACSSYRRRFQFGSVFYVYGQAAAFEVNGDIAAKYAFLGENGSALGFPTTDETPVGDGYGYFNHFEHGSIYWKANLGPHALWGPIHDTWMQQGAQSNPSLGYPLWDEAAVVGGRDLMVSFENGVLYWRQQTQDVLTLNGTTFGYSPDKVVTMVHNAVQNQFGNQGFVFQPALIGVSDYSRNGSGWPHNRRFTFDVPAQIFSPVGSPAWADMSLTIEIYFNAAQSEVDYQLIEWQDHVTGEPGVVNAVQSQITDKLNGIVGKPQTVTSAPAATREVKPMSDGSLNVYISPLIAF
jgi:hypothetical protein